VMRDREQSRKSASQKPYSSSLGAGRKDDGFGDLLARPLVHMNDRAGILATTT
jgi:hypothetical protein